MSRPNPWQARRQEIADLILHDGWLMTDLAEYYGLSVERIRQVVRALDIPYSLAKSVQLWCPWQPSVRPCVDCGQPTYPGTRVRGRCEACHGRWRYANNPDYRAKHREWVRRWWAENHENWRDVQGRAYQRKKAAGLCVACREAAVPGRVYCAKHAAKARARYQAQKAAAQEAAA